MKKTPLIFCFTLACLTPTAFAQAPAARGLAPAPAKVIRYADIFLQRYDINGDGILQQEEWEKMPGTPQIIDLNGDGQITKDELLWYFRHYGQSRTIYRTIAIDLSEPYQFDPANMRLFQPVWQRPSPPPPPVPDVATQEQTEESIEAMMSANEQPIDDELYQKMLEERQIPSSRPYHVLPEHLQSVPRWFILLDKNGDGQVSLAEFAPTLSLRDVGLFRRLDKNNNGVIEPDEVRSAANP